MFFPETNFIPISRKSTSRLCTHTLAIILCPETGSFRGSYIKNIMRLILLISVSKMNIVKNVPTEKWKHCASYLVILQSIKLIILAKDV